MKKPLISGLPNEGACKGFTLLEVMVSAAILGILAVVATTALFYPRLLVVNSNIEQSAIHAGIAEIERHLHDSNSAADEGTFNADGWNIHAETTPNPLTTYRVTNTTSDTCEYLPIHVTATYRDGKTVELITYRSLEDMGGR